MSKFSVVFLSRCISNRSFAFLGKKGSSFFGFSSFLTVDEDAVSLKFILFQQNLGHGEINEATCRLVVNKEIHVKVKSYIAGEGGFSSEVKAGAGVLSFESEAITDAEG